MNTMTPAQKARISIDNIIPLLREKPQESTLVERYFLIDEAWEAYRDCPQPIQQGKGLYYVLDHASLPIAPHDLLLGRFDDHVPTPKEQARLDDIWQNRPLHLNPVTRHNGGHLTLDTRMVLQAGLPGMLRAAEERLARAQAEGEAASSQIFLEGMVWVWKAILRYVERYGKAAAEAGEVEMAEVCRALTEGAPTTFRQGLQLTIFLYNIYLIYAGTAVACLNMGRVDDDLLPLYLDDLAAGRLDETTAGALIDDFYAKMSLHLGRGEHQMANPAEGGAHTGWTRNPVYDSPGYINLGGYSNHTDHKENPLTLLFARRIEPKLKNPVVICRFTGETTDELWSILCQKIHDNASLLLYNDETVIAAHQYIGVDEQNARDYSIHPCNWADIAGGSSIVGGAGGPIPIMLNETFAALLQKGGEPTIDDIYQTLAAQFTASLAPIFAGYRARYCAEKLPEAGALSLDDCFLQGPLERARGNHEGGVKYPAIYVQLRNIGTAADMMAAIEQLVFTDKKCTFAELVGAAGEDFANRADLMALCQKALKYGTGSEMADAHATRLLNVLLDAVDAEATNADGVRDVYTLNVPINDMNHRWQGLHCGATVDGRRCNAPLSENMSPTVGHAREITTLLSSVAKLPTGRLHAGALNVRLRRDAVRGETGLSRLRALIETYFKLGGMQLQVNLADTAELREAQKHPDAYRDLSVRITGYSAIFVDMSPGAQEEIIRRDELG